MKKKTLNLKYQAKVRKSPNQKTKFTNNKIKKNKVLLIFIIFLKILNFYFKQKIYITMALANVIFTFILDLKDQKHQVQIFMKIHVIIVFMQEMLNIVVLH